METAALDLLGLPDDLLSGALSRLCSAIALVNLAATCTRLRALCKQAAEVLLEEAGAAATTIAARIAGAFTLRNLALLCGRAPLITERFHEHVQTVATEVLRSAQMSCTLYKGKALSRRKQGAVWCNASSVRQCATAWSCT